MTGKSSIADALAADAESAAAPPRANGELVFEEPWESRAFGVAVALSERDAFEWERFRQELIAEIGAWEREHGERDLAGWSYYERWVASLEHLLLADGLLDADEIAARMAEIEAHDEHEHDHEHGHDHHHDHQHHH
jgi:nitrile hydratase accessory protein